jgi:hypothetical protein
VHDSWRRDIRDRLRRDSTDPDAKPKYALSAVPRPDQFACASRGEAERVGRSSASRARVDLWLAESPNAFTALARFRGTER